MAVLVLNASYEPLNVVTVRRAVVLLLLEKAQLVEAAEARLRAERFSMPQPASRSCQRTRNPRRRQSQSPSIRRQSSLFSSSG